MHAHHLDVPDVTGRRLRAIAIAAAALTVAGMVVLRPSSGPLPGQARVGNLGEVYDAVVTDVVRAPCTDAPVDERLTEPICVDATLRLLEGPDRGETTTIHLPDSPTTPSFGLDERIVLAYQADAEPGFRYSFVDRHRKPVLVWIALLFAAAVIGLGRLRGLAALAGLAISVLVLLRFVLPAVLSGRPPLAVAVVGASAIAFVALYLAHGFSPMTTVALLGALGSLLLTALLADAFVSLAQLSGFTTEEAILVKLSNATIDASGLVLAGIVMGALGALDDVTVTQASAVAEVRHADPSISRRNLYRAGLRIGRDHVASTVNTLLLAYAGASLPLLLFFVLSEQSFGTVVNQEVVATEVIRTLAGSIGLVASVPLTTWLAALVAAPRQTARA